MDSRTFDRWTTAFAHRPSRRATVRLFAAGALAGLFSPRLAHAALQADRDGDGLFDDDETGVYGTNPDLFDTDGDGSGDGEEVYLGTDPLMANAASARADSDGDGLYDLDETSVYGTSATAFDSDGDGVGDGEEVYLGTDPLAAGMSTAPPACPAHCCPKPAPGTVVQYTCPPGTDPEIGCPPPCYTEYVVDECVC